MKTLSSLQTAKRFEEGAPSVCTGLSPYIAVFSKTFRFLNEDHWPDPLSLATTNGVSVDVLSSGY